MYCSFISFFFDTIDAWSDHFKNECSKYNLNRNLWTFFQHLYINFITLAPDLIVQCDGIEFILRPRGHVSQGLSRGLSVLEDVLDGGLQVEGLDQRRLVQSQSVSHAPDLFGNEELSKSSSLMTS